MKNMGHPSDTATHALPSRTSPATLIRSGLRLASGRGTARSHRMRPATAPLKKRALAISPGDSIKSACKWTATAAIATAVLGNSASAVAQPHVLRLAPTVNYDLSVTNVDGDRVFDSQGAPNGNAVDPVVLGGKVRFSPKLCDGTYQVTLVFTTNKGIRTPMNYTARVGRGRLDGISRQCPFAGLPSHGLTAMDVRANIGGARLLDFVAHPTGSDYAFSRLDAPTIRFYRTHPAGLARVLIRARYPGHKSHIVRFLADLRQLSKP